MTMTLKSISALIKSEVERDRDGNGESDQRVLIATLSGQLSVAVSLLRRAHAETPPAADATDDGQVRRRALEPSSAPPQLCGLLSKQGDRGPLRAWKSRWFQQRREKLYYYRRADDHRPISFIVLTAHGDDAPKLEIVDVAACRFNIVTVGRVYKLRANSSEDFAYWTEGLQAVLAGAGRGRNTLPRMTDPQPVEQPPRSPTPSPSPPLSREASFGQMDPLPVAEADLAPSVLAHSFRQDEADSGHEQHVLSDSQSDVAASDRPSPTEQRRPAAPASPPPSPAQREATPPAPASKTTTPVLPDNTPTPLSTPHLLSLLQSTSARADSLDASLRQARLSLAAAEATVLSLRGAATASRREASQTAALLKRAQSSDPSSSSSSPSLTSPAEDATDAPTSSWSLFGGSSARVAELEADLKSARAACARAGDSAAAHQAHASYLSAELNAARAVAAAVQETANADARADAAERATLRRELADLRAATVGRADEGVQTFLEQVTEEVERTRTQLFYALVTNAKLIAAATGQETTNVVASELLEEATIAGVPQGQWADWLTRRVVKAASATRRLTSGHPRLDV